MQRPGADKQLSLTFTFTSLHTATVLRYRGSICLPGERWTQPAAHRTPGSGTNFHTDRSKCEIEPTKQAQSSFNPEVPHCCHYCSDVSQYTETLWGKSKKLISLGL